jgi:hypothetical protein
MSGLMKLKKLNTVVQSISEPAAMLRCEKCQYMGGMHKMHAGKARMGMITAVAYRGKDSSAMIVGVLKRFQEVREMKLEPT